LGKAVELDPMLSEGYVVLSMVREWSDPKRHRITLNQESHPGITTVTQDQAAILTSLNVSKPTESKQLKLL